MRNLYTETTSKFVAKINNSGTGKGTGTNPLNHEDHMYDYTTLERLTHKEDGTFELKQCLPDFELKAKINEWLKTHKPL